MKRAGWLLLAVAPVATAAVFLFGGPGDPGDGRDEGARPARHDERGGTTDGAGADARAIAEAPPGLADAAKKEIALKIVASAENSTLDWRSQYGYIEDLDDGRGYTAGIVGFCTGTHDLLTLVERYTRDHPGNALARFLPALRAVDGGDSHRGLDPDFTAAWRAESATPAFRAAQEAERDRAYFDPAVRQGKLDGLSTLGQFVYFDAMVLHGPGTGPTGFYGLRDAARARAAPPDEGGDERAYLNAFLDVGRAAMRARGPRTDTSRIDTAQRLFVRRGDMDLATPLEWRVYGETYRIP